MSELITKERISLKETTIQGWCRGFVPQNLTLINWLAHYCVRWGRVDRQWAESFLMQAGYPEREALLSRLFSDAPGSAEHQQTGNHKAEAGLFFSPIEDPLLPLVFPSRRRLVGRETCLQDLRTRLLEGEPLLALYGLPGVGKTTMTLALAR